MNVLVIPEDFRKDQFILQSVISAMFAKLGRPAIVRVLRDPLIGGVERAMDRRLLEAIVQANRWKVDVFLLCVDRDGDTGRRAVLDGLEEHFVRVLGPGKFFACEHAWQEVEVWALAGQDLPPEWDWQKVRAERDSKERFFLPWVRSRGLQHDPGGGARRWGLRRGGNTGAFTPVAGRMFKSWSTDWPNTWPKPSWSHGRKPSGGFDQPLSGCSCAPHQPSPRRLPSAATHQPRHGILPASPPIAHRRPAAHLSFGFLGPPGLPSGP